MHEIVLNLHMHTFYSDGHATHAQIAQAALKAGLDAVIVTDHNVLVQGMEAYHEANGRRLLLLVGEEIHDPKRDPQKNHLLVFGAGRELAPFSADPQRLLDQVRGAGGLAFIAHPIDPANAALGEGDLSWVDWQVRGYTGIELWNGFSELKSVARSMLAAAFYVFFPNRMARGPLPETLALYDRLTAGGRRVAAVGGSDAHALPRSLGPIHKTVFPYEFHFRSVNTHLLLPGPLTGELASDRHAILGALREGRGFIGHDLHSPTRGFRFTARGRDETASMGQEMPVHGGVTLQIRLPHTAEVRLIKDGSLLRTWRETDNLVQTATEPGVYRVEAYLPTRYGRRGWIFSNPIYLKA